MRLFVTTFFMLLSCAVLAAEPLDRLTPADLSIPPYGCLDRAVFPENFESLIGRPDGHSGLQILGGTSPAICGLLPRLTSEHVHGRPPCMVLTKRDFETVIGHPVSGFIDTALFGIVACKTRSDSSPAVGLYPAADAGKPHPSAADLASPDPAVRRAAYRALSASDREQVRAVVKDLSAAAASGDAGARDRAARAFVSLVGKTGALDDRTCLLWANLAASEPASTAPVAAAFASAAPRCEEFFRAFHVVVPVRLLENLGQRGTAAEESFLVAMGSTAVGGLLPALADSARADAAARVLARIGPSAVPGLAEVVRSHPSPEARRRAASALFRLGPPLEAIPALASALTDAETESVVADDFVKADSAAVAALAATLNAGDDARDRKVRQVLARRSPPPAPEARSDGSIHADFPPNSGRFDSPKKLYSVRFTQTDLRTFDKSKITDADQVDQAVYRIEFFDYAGKLVSSCAFIDVYGWTAASHQTPLDALSHQITWSAEDDYAVLPPERWASAPGTNDRLAVALDRTLPWKTSRFRLDSVQWVDRFVAIGDDTQDCAYSVTEFDGNSGRTTPLKAANSPQGFFLVSTDGKTALLRQETDNCGIGEKAPPSCLRIDLATRTERPETCP